MTKRNMTYHASNERYDRLAYIVDCFAGDFGTQVASLTRHDSTEILYSTGVVFIHNAKTNRLITGYIATMKEATRIYRGYTKSNRNMPDGLYKRILKNKPLYENQPQGKELSFF